ncbi:hypothetical protein [Streptomyces sp. MBT61]|nr:hypothetical protein [Streptomyces sp. MBT61]
MDVDRYLKSIEDRVNGGVQLALREAGYETDEFEQKIVHIGAGGVFIESAKDSAIGIGDHNDIRRSGPAAPAGPGTKNSPGSGRSPGAAPERKPRTGEK